MQPILSVFILACFGFGLAAAQCQVSLKRSQDGLMTRIDSLSTGDFAQILKDPVQGTTFGLSKSGQSESLIDVNGQQYELTGAQRNLFDSFEFIEGTNYGLGGNQTNQLLVGSTNGEKYCFNSFGNGTHVVMHMLYDEVAALNIRQDGLHSLFSQNATMVAKVFDNCSISLMPFSSLSWDDLGLYFKLTSKVDTYLDLMDQDHYHHRYHDYHHQRDHNQQQSHKKYIPKYFEDDDELDDLTWDIEPDQPAEQEKHQEKQARFEPKDEPQFYRQPRYQNNI